MRKTWRVIGVLLGWPLLAAGLCGCDLGLGSQESASPAKPSAAGLSAPAPARFGSPQQPQLSPAAAELMAGARELAAIGPAASSGPDVDLKAVQEGRVRFDGSGRQTSSPTPVSAAGSPAPALAGKPLVVKAGMAIDTDGAYQGSDPRLTKDPHRQKQTSLRYADGTSLNPVQIPYVVVPKKNKALLGDLVEVEYRGRRVLAVVGDCGPRFGEGSVALAELLGIPASGVSGGVSGGVTYSFYPGSGKRYSGPTALKTALASPAGGSGTRLASL